MIVVGTKKVRSFEKGLYFRDGEFRGVLETGRHWFFDPLNRVEIDIVSQRTPWLVHKDLDIIVNSGALGEDALVLDIDDNQRALIRVDGRFDRVLDAGLYVVWTGVRNVEVEFVDARKVLFTHKDLSRILVSQGVEKVLDTFTVGEGHVGVYFKEGQYMETLKPGQYAFWKKAGRVKLYQVDMRDKVMDISGQDIMSADKVSLRLNAVVTYRVVDARRSVERAADVDRVLYREAQLALRAIIGSVELDTLLADKNVMAGELESAMRKRAESFGIKVITLGIRDVILPGDMKMLLNKVIEARKASEANVIARKEETAAMRSQMNTAKLIEGNPVLMRLRELEVLEKVAQSSKLNVVLGEKGLADRIVNLL